jgi:hypothetical protein
MTYYVNPYTGSTISPSQVGYESLSISTNTTLQWPINGTTSGVVANIIEVTATTGGLKLILPTATQVSTGQSFLIKNVGNTNTFTVVKNDTTTTIVSISSGLAYYVYLTDNTTTNGTWAFVQFGASTSVANASSLVGYGLEAIGTTLNTITPIVTYYSGFTMLPTAQSQISVWGGGAGTITLPTSASTGSGWYTIVKNNGTGILTVATQGTDTIDGSSTFQLQIGESFYLVSEGSGGYASWGYGQSAIFAFTQEQISVTGASSTITLTATQASYVLQNFTGTLSQNTNVVVPQTVQFYVITNSTTGSFTLTFKTSVGGGSTVTIPTGTTYAVVCDGTNMVAVSASTNSSNSITLSAGTASNPPLNFTGNLSTGIYLPSSSQVGITISGTQAAVFSSTGLYVVNGISGGSF